jgi:protein-tyrosine phosphatase
MDNYNEIITNLFLGNIIAANDKTFIDKYNIKYIINLSNENINTYPNIKYKHININDDPSENIYDYFDKCVDMIEDCLNNNKAILVNCKLGLSRSASIIVAYFIKIKKLSVAESYDVVNNKRPININFGFLEQLNRYSLYDKKRNLNLSFKKYFINK